MKFLLGLVAVIAAVNADVSHLVNNEYLPPVQYPSAPISSGPQYHNPISIGPEEHVHVPSGQHHHAPAPSGQHHFAPVPSGQHHYAPVSTGQHHYAPVPSVPHHHAPAPVTNDYLPPLSNGVDEVEPAHELTDDGYVYKNPVDQRRRAKRRYRLRYRTHRY